MDKPAGGFALGDFGGAWAVALVVAGCLAAVARLTVFGSGAGSFFAGVFSAVVSWSL